MSVDELSVNMLPSLLPLAPRRWRVEYYDVILVAATFLGLVIMKSYLLYVKQAEAVRSRELAVAIRQCREQAESAEIAAQAERETAHKDAANRQSQQLFSDMVTLGNASENTVCLMQLKRTSKGMEMVGQVDSMATLNRYIERLSVSHSFSALTLVGIKQQKKSGLFHFQLRSGNKR